MQELAYLPLLFVPFIFSLCFHEAAHAWMASRCGDQTAKMMGRLTLNPMAHIDIVGTIVFPIIAFVTGMPLIGWAKPVPVIERNFRNWRKDGLLVAAAGPVSNLILAVGFTVVLFGLNRISPSHNTMSAGFMIQEPLVQMAVIGIRLNLMLALFNFVPIPPLDGGRVAVALFPQFAPQLAALERYGMVVLYLLLATGVLKYVVFLPAAILFNALLGLTL